MRLAFDEFLQTGASSAQVVRRRKDAFEDLMTVAPPERQRPLARQLDLLQAAVAKNDWPDADRPDVSSDRQGIGSAKELRTISGGWS